MSDQTPGSPDSTDTMPENVPAPTGEVGQVGVRQGMFGVSGTGDTSGYGGMVSAVTFPAPAQRPFGGWYDEVADALGAAARSAGLEHALGDVVIHRGEITFSMTWNRRIRVEVTAPDSDPHVPTVSDTYPAADWHERETWDMFGIVFDGHPALTRILMPDDWPGHPQRKDYPLGGIPVEYKGGTVPPPDQRRSYN